MSGKNKQHGGGKSCDTKYCKNKCNGSFCNTCMSRKARAADPVKYSYYTLRTNTIRRKGIAWFELTLEEFRQYCYETNYIAGKGRSRLSHTIDRLDNDMGYFIGNIRPMLKGANSSKGSKVLQYDWETKSARVDTRHPVERDSNMPF